MCCLSRRLDLGPGQHPKERPEDSECWGLGVGVQVTGGWGERGQA